MRVFVPQSCHALAQGKCFWQDGPLQYLSYLYHVVLPLYTIWLGLVPLKLTLPPEIRPVAVRDSL
jgi:hypothetical protein